jgi:hypothetical protein
MTPSAYPTVPKIFTGTEQIDKNILKLVRLSSKGGAGGIMSPARKKEE